MTPRRAMTVLAVAGLLVSGCGSSTGGSATPASIAAAPAATASPAAGGGGSGAPSSGGATANGGGTGGSPGGGSPGGGSPGGTGPGGTAAGGGAAANGGIVAAAPVDACPLLKPEEVAAVIGPNDGGRPGPSTCTWRNAAAATVSINIGQPDTAAAGLPPWDPARGPEKPLPNTMRSLGSGQVEFIANRRDCTAQVTAPGGSGDEQRAVGLATILQDRL